MSDSDKIRWNKRYSEKDPASINTQPSSWLQQQENLILQQPNGKALDLACGYGRNALYLAGLGFEVDALDISAAAIDWLKGKAKEMNLPIKAEATDLDQLSLPQSAYQIILNFNFLDRRLFPFIKTALVPGGLLFFETFSVDHVAILGAQMPTQYTLGHNELQQAFANFDILDYREGVFSTERSLKLKGVASLLGRKPYQ